MVESELLGTRIFLAKVTPKICRKYKIKDLKGEKTIGSFYIRELLLSKL